MPDATAMAGVDMRLEPNGYRELHWHVAAEWSLVLNGSCRVQVYGNSIALIIEVILTISARL
jgi:hypothetical protein